MKINSRGNVRDSTITDFLKEVCVIDKYNNKPFLSFDLPSNGAEVNFYSFEDDHCYGVKINMGEREVVYFRYFKEKNSVYLDLELHKVFKTKLSDIYYADKGIFDIDNYR